MFKYHILLHFCIHIIENVQNISQHISCLILKTITNCLFVSKMDFRFELISNKSFCLENTKNSGILSKTLMFFRSKLVFSQLLGNFFVFLSIASLKNIQFFSFFKMIHIFRKHRSLIFCCSRIQSSEVFVFAQWCLKLKEYFFY